MSLATYALTDVQGVEDALGASPYSQPNRIEAMINIASLGIIRYAGREFRPLNASTVRTFPMTPDGFVSFSPSEAQTIALIRANIEGTQPSTLDATQYQAFTNPDSGLTSSLQLLWNYYLPAIYVVASNYYGPTVKMQGIVEVTGTWGWTSVPPDVKEWCEFQVVQWIRRNSQIRSTAGAADSGETAAPAYMGLSLSVKRAIDEAYRVPVVA